MSSVAYAFVDVFASRPLTGNPLSLVPDADGLEETQMRAIARTRASGVSRRLDGSVTTAVRSIGWERRRARRLTRPRRGRPPGRRPDRSSPWPSGWGPRAGLHPGRACSPT